MIQTVYGTVLSKGLENILGDVGAKFSPHSIHIFFNDIESSDLKWQIEAISDGGSFRTRSICGKYQDRINVFMNCSLTSKNSYQALSIKYDEYMLLIKTRRAQGKTIADDEEEEIKRVFYPLKLQVPFPASIKQFSLSSIDLLIVGNIELKLIASVKFDLAKDCYNNPVKFLAKVAEPQANKFVGLALLTDAHDIIELDYGYQILSRIVYIHDDDFDPNQFMTFQTKVLSVTYGKLLLETEIFNHKEVHVGTVIQENYLWGTKL